MRKNLTVLACILRPCTVGTDGVKNVLSKAMVKKLKQDNVGKYVLKSEVLWHQMTCVWLACGGFLCFVFVFCLHCGEWDLSVSFLFTLVDEKKSSLVSLIIVYEVNSSLEVTVK